MRIQRKKRFPLKTSEMLTPRQLSLSHRQKRKNLQAHHRQAGTSPLEDQGARIERIAAGNQELSLSLGVSTQSERLGWREVHAGRADQQVRGEGEGDEQREHRSEFSITREGAKAAQLVPGEAKTGRAGVVGTPCAERETSGGDERSAKLTGDELHFAFSARPPRCRGWRDYASGAQHRQSR